MKIMVTQPSPQASTSRCLLLRKFKTFLLLFVSALIVLPAWAQNSIKVKGRITNERNQPVASASIVVKGTNNGTTTKDNGEFELNAPSNGVLVISSVGFNPVEVDIRGRTTINTQLSTAGTTLEQVVVVGYGTQRREAVTGSVASISAEKLLEVPAPNITQAIQGRLPGVEMSQTSTRPGATMQIRIRGARSLTGSNDPLVVLDGIPFPGNIADINPNDVKSIDVLKDASATAIYGSRGANGVILITTNKGQKRGKPKVSYNAYYGAQTLFAKYPMMDSKEFIALRKAANIYQTNGPDEYDSVNTNWQDLFYRNGFVNSHNVNLSGGTETGSYNFGLEYYQNQAVIPTQKYKRYSLRGAIDQQVGKYFSVGFTTNTNTNMSEGNQVGLYGILSMSPIASPYNVDGSLKRIVKLPLDDQYVWTEDVLEGLKDQYVNESKGFATYNAIYGEVKFPWVEGLKYRANLGLDFIQNNSGNYTGQGVGAVNATTVSTAGTSNSHRYHWVLENLLSYDQTFAQKHRVNAVAMYSAEQNRFHNSNMSAKEIPVDAFQYYNLGSALDPNSVQVGGGYNLTGLTSWMGRVMYSYENRYMLTATVRSDASSVLAPGHKWHTYPAVSAGWNISNESFMKGIRQINMLKLRAGYGETSNQAVGAYQTLGALGTRQYNFGDTYATGFYVTQGPNPELGWEYSSTWNYGLDFGLLNNRISGSIEYYVTNTKDILQNVGLPATSGFGYYTGNVGKIQNKGWEFGVNGTILQNRNGWTWEAGLNFYTNDNKIVALASGKDRDEGNGWFVDHNINAIFDYERTGLWQKDDPYLTTLEPGGKIGMIKVKYTGGFNPDGTPVRAIGAADRQIMDVDPDFQGGFNTRVSYKGFDFSAVAAFRHGGILVSNLHGPNGYLNMLTGRRGQIKVDYWTPENTDAKYPNPAGPLSGDNPKYASTLAYFDGSYLKVRTLTLGYNFSQNVIRNSDVKLRMYVTVQNPFVMFSPYNEECGMDPETNSYGNENVATGGYQRRILSVGFNTPSTRNYLVGLNLTF